MMMGTDRPYAFMTLGKVKSLGTLTAKGNHNMRVKLSDNVIPELSELNRVYTNIGESWDVEVPEGKTKEEVTFADAFKARIATLPYYQNHKTRPDAVYAYELVMSYTKDDTIDPYAWAEKNMEWVHQTFDRAGDGKSNVLHAVLHMDEPGNPHMHVIVVPIDAECRLNAKSFTNGSRVMRHLQDTYAEAVSECGLQRGVPNSSAKHKDIQKMYANINIVKDNYPMPRDGQTAKEYHGEIQEYIETMMLSGYKELEDNKTRDLQEVDRYRNEAREVIRNDLEANKAVLRHERKLHQQEIDTQQQKLDTLNKDITEAQDQLAILQRQLEATQLVFQNLTEDTEEYEKHKKIRKGVRVLQMLDPEEAEKYIYYTDQIIAYGEEYDIDTIEIEPELD